MLSTVMFAGRELTRRLSRTIKDQRFDACFVSQDTATGQQRLQDICLSCRRLAATELSHFSFRVGQGLLSLTEIVFRAATLC